MALFVIFLYFFFPTGRYCLGQTCVGPHAAHSPAQYIVIQPGSRAVTLKIHGMVLLNPKAPGYLDGVYIGSKEKKTESYYILKSP